MIMEEKEEKSEPQTAETEEPQTAETEEPQTAESAEKPKKTPFFTAQFLIIAITSFLIYLACYATKSLLSVNSPQMIKEGYDSVAIGAMSSVYFLCYGAGQLAVGFIGDKIKLKYMLLIGMSLAAASCFSFAAFDNIAVKTVVWGVCGFGLSFLYAPLVKSISDRLEGRPAEICMTLLNLASIAGSSVAGIFGIFGNWKLATYVFAGILLVLAIGSFAVNAVFDKKFPLKNTPKAIQTESMPLKRFMGHWLKNGMVAFVLISAVQGIAKNSITFWTPTYISDNLGFSPQITSVIFTVMTLIAALNQIAAIFLYHLMKEKIMWVTRFSFLLSTVCFLLLIPIKNVYANIVLLLIATSGYSWAGTMIWTYYCRSFKQSGRVAFVVGALDFISYFFAAISSLLFSDAIVKIGWTYLTVIWAVIMFAGALSTLFYNVKSKS